MTTTTSPQKTWPLFLLAALSFVPFLGILLGVGATCWGLLTERRRGLLAAALAAFGTILNIGVMAALGQRALTREAMPGGVAAQIARTELVTLVSYIERFHTQRGRYPDSLKDLSAGTGLGEALPLLDHSVSLLNVKTFYHYRLLPDGETYALSGAGADGVVGSGDDIVITLPDSIRAGSGYRPPRGGP